MKILRVYELHSGLIVEISWCNSDLIRTASLLPSMIASYDDILDSNIVSSLSNAIIQKIRKKP